MDYALENAQDFSDDPNYFLLHGWYSSLVFDLKKISVVVVVSA